MDDVASLLRRPSIFICVNDPSHLRMFACSPDSEKRYNEGNKIKLAKRSTTELPGYVITIIAAEKGFEPPTFWFIDPHYLFTTVSQLGTGYSNGFGQTVQV